jgi:transposase InsO family protein
MMPQVAAARVLRWSLVLAGYDYTLRYRKSGDHGNADAMSRLPLPTTSADASECSTDIVLFVEQGQRLCTADDLQRATRQDPCLAKVVICLQSGNWPKPLTSDLVPYQRRAVELSIVNGLVMWGQRVIVPASLRDTVKAELHEGHFGGSHMKALARSYVWWPNLDGELESTAAACSLCQQYAHAQPKTAAHPWPVESRPWTRLHIDYAGPVDGWMLLIIVDAYSRWIEAIPTHSITSVTTCKLLRHVFATHGLPEVLVSDNGPCFASDEFGSFCTANGIRHLRTAPYHPASNGLAERAVQTVKQGLLKQQGDDIHIRLDRFLLNYRRTPQSTTNTTPAELLFCRAIRTRLDWLRPSLESAIHAKQEKWSCVNKRDRPPFECGDSIMARNYGAGPRWMPAVVADKRSPHSILVKSHSGVHHRHPDQLISRKSDATFDVPSLDDDDDWQLPSAKDTMVPDTQPPQPDLRRSSRVRREPDRLTY